MDTILIFVGAIVFIAAIAVLVVVYLKKANAKYAQLWAPLAGFVSGTSKGSKLTGTFNSMPVQARINAVSDDNSTDYFYELVLTPGAQGKDWSLSYTGDKLLGMGAKSWHVKTKDDGLKQRLAESVLPTLEQWPSFPEITYKAKGGTLKYAIKVKSMYAIPGLDEFKQELELLARLGEINRQVNQPAGQQVSVA
ncbi:MAG: hypothetical protein CYG59_14250 [Chloroflexi bacterium]|nr:MAG: hypothetical protein CYG59_14250 [Chloroflexota bacterium]